MNIWSFIGTVFGDKATAGILAAIAILGTFVIYVLRRADHKRDAANIILLEIKNAERKFKEAQSAYEQGKSQDPARVTFPEKLRFMPTESWTKYKYLFVRNFEPEQWDEIGAYYENCKNFDEALSHRDGNFEANENLIRSGIQQNISNYAKRLAEIVKPNPDQDKGIDRANEKKIDDIVRKSAAAVNYNIKNLVYIYNPDKSFTDAEYYFKLLPSNITNTQTGRTLKRLSSSFLKRIFSQKI